MDKFKTTIEPKKISEGVAQGYIIGPILYYLFNSEIPLSDDCQIVGYNVIYYSTTTNQLVLLVAGKQYITKYPQTFSEYYKDLGMTTNDSKTQLITSRTRTRNQS